MIYRTYGKTGKQVSAIGFGGMRFADVDNTDSCVEMMLHAAKGGITYFDTAPGYFKTKSESVYGEGFAELKRAGLPFFCASKTFAADESGIRKEIEGQLKRLRLPSIDFYHIWCITSLQNWEGRKKKGVVQTFRKLKEEGLIKHICVSSHLIGDEIKTLLDEGIFEGVLFGYSAYNFKARTEAFDAIRKQGLGCVVMNPLGGGLIPQHPELFEFLKTRKEETAVEAALRFLLAHEDITVSLVGFSNIKEIDEALNAVSGYKPLSKAQISLMKEKAGRSFEGICTGCQYCDDCPEGIPIPKYMDAYNHKLLYGSDEQLLERLKDHWGIPQDLAARCVECGKCEGACTQHLPIIDRLKEVAKAKKRA